MIYLFSGDDLKNKIKAYENFLASFPKDTEIFYFSKNDFNEEQIKSFYSGNGLFFNKCAVVFSNIFDLERAEEFILDKLSLLGDSKNNFIFLESKLNKPILDAFKKTRTELNIFELSKEKKEKFNNFLLAEAFAHRDKLNLWIYFRQAVHLGISLEELIGVLIWKVKDMIIKKNFTKFKEEELKNFVTKLTYILPKSRNEGKDDEAYLEQFLLEAL
jgi:DNA polymerase III delta subunit